MTAGPAQAAYSAECNINGEYFPWPDRSTRNGNNWEISPGGFFASGAHCQIGKTKLIMQSDSNLVVYDENKNVRWRSKTAWVPDGAVARFQGDGNFVVYNPVDKPVWASNTCCLTTNRLVVQGDGNVVIYSGSTVLWATNTNH